MVQPTDKLNAYYKKGAKMVLKKKTTRQLSIAVGLLSFAAFIVQGLSTTWGFEEVGKQIAQTALLFSGGINIYFLGVTNQKNNAEKEEQENDAENNK